MAVAAIAAVVALERSDSTDDVAAAERVETCTRALNPPRCLRREFAAAARRGDVAPTLAALEVHARKGDIDDCHLLAHRLAHAVYSVVGDVRRTFLLGGPQCRMGYLHGAVEASGSTPVAGSPGTHGVPLPPCDGFAVGAQRSACAHGFGHALMLGTRHDIRASVAGCARAAARGLDREACELGVMMQNSLRYASRSDFAAASAHGCRTVANSPRLTRLCFDNIGVVAALSHGHDPVRATAECARLAPGRARSSCVSGARNEVAEARGEGSL